MGSEQATRFLISDDEIFMDDDDEDGAKDLFGEPMDDDEWEMANKYASHYRDIDGVYLDDDNDVKFYRFSCE